MSKQEMRKRLAALSFSEKVKILEKLRDRSLALAASGMRRRAERTDNARPVRENASQLPKVFADFHNSDQHGRVRLNTVGTLEDLRRLGIVLQEGTPLLLSCLEVEAEGTATYSTEEERWVARIDWENIRSRPGNE
jgi:hypothetical protein